MRNGAVQELDHEGNVMLRILEFSPKVQANFYFRSSRLVSERRPG